MAAPVPQREAQTTVSIHLNITAKQASEFAARANAFGQSIEQWLIATAENSVRQEKNLADLLLASPLAGSELKLEPISLQFRDVDLPENA